MSDSLRILFMGTPEFAVSSLEALVANDLAPVAVVTAPDRPSGRGLQLTPSPVKQCALALGLPVLQPEKLRDPAFLSEIEALNLDLMVVVAFRMLPELVWRKPRLGTFNLHASLLPDYRGAAPINWAIIRGETETGITTFFIEKAIDTGHIIFQEKEPIHTADTAGSLYERLRHKGAALVVRTVKAIAAGNYPQQPQPSVLLEKTAPKLQKETCQIQWQQPAEQIRNFVRGLAPFPGAWTHWRGQSCKVFGVSIQPDAQPDTPVGQWHTDQKKELWCRAADAWVKIEELQLEGKKRMKTDELLRGIKWS
jgi:methionyl-tRNA formyltransferase